MNKIMPLFLFMILFFSQVSFANDYSKNNINVNLDKKNEVLNTVSNSEIKKLDYNFLNTNGIRIKLSPTKKMNTKNGILEGEIIELKVNETVEYNGKVLVQKGDIAHARIETYITKGMNGFPSELIINNFQINGLKQSKILGEYVKDGANRCFWVYPLKWALTPIPFVGSFTNLILGGEVYLKPSDVITVYYFPDWI